jgi:hypothetical protein
MLMANTQDDIATLLELAATGAEETLAERPSSKCAWAASVVCR